MNTQDVNAHFSGADNDPDQPGLFEHVQEAPGFSVPLATMMKDLGAAVTMIQDARALGDDSGEFQKENLTARIEGVLKNKGGDWVKVSVYGDNPKKVLDSFFEVSTLAQLNYEFALNANELATHNAGAQPVPYNVPAPQPSPNLSPNMQPTPTTAGQTGAPAPVQQSAGSNGGTNAISNITVSVTNDGKTFVQVAAQGLQYPLKDSRQPALVLKAFDPALLIENGGFWSAEKLATPGAYSQNQMVNTNGIVIQQSWGGYPLYVTWERVPNPNTGKSYYNIKTIHR